MGRIINEEDITSIITNQEMKNRECSLPSPLSLKKEIL
nr:MAG TPA: hypothetical protein [Caudoviricetes sp.]